jgi:hypothetical protein
MKNRNTFAAVFDPYVQAADTALWVGTKKALLTLSINMR